MELKDTKCSGCNTLRKKTDFIYKEKVNKTCSKCYDNRLKNKEKNKEKNKQYYTQNTEKIKEQVQKYAIQNKDKIKEQHQKNCERRKKENPLHIKIQAMLYSSKSTDKKLNRIYEKADYIDYDFLLGLWETQTGLCGYETCKCEMVLTFNLETRNPQQISIQRLDNNIAHIKSNVILSCFECNVIKRMETKP